MNQKLFMAAKVTFYYGTCEGLDFTALYCTSEGLYCTVPVKVWPAPGPASSWVLVWCAWVPILRTGLPVHVKMASYRGSGLAEVYRYRYYVDTDKISQLKIVQYLQLCNVGIFSLSD